MTPSDLQSLPWGPKSHPDHLTEEQRSNLLKAAGLSIRGNGVIAYDAAQPAWVVILTIPLGLGNTMERMVTFKQPPTPGNTPP